MKEQEPFDLDKRLRAYYGPLLLEHSLSQDTWRNLRTRLGSQADAGRRHLFRWRLLQKGPQVDVPTYIQNAFARITSYDSHISSRPWMLYCSLKPHIRVPVVRSSWRR